MQVVQISPILVIEAKGIVGDKTAKWCLESGSATAGVNQVPKVSAKFLSEMETSTAGKIRLNVCLVDFFVSLVFVVVFCFCLVWFGLFCLVSDFFSVPCPNKY